jgi:hypothetical protein
MANGQIINLSGFKGGLTSLSNGSKHPNGFSASALTTDLTDGLNESGWTERSP